MENVPGLGASGYVESASDFKLATKEKAAHGRFAHTDIALNSFVFLTMLSYSLYF